MHRHRRRNRIRSSSLSEPRFKLAPESLKFLVEVAKPLPQIATRVYEQLKLNSRKGVALARRLEHQHLIKAHHFTTGKKGGTITVYVPTDRGWQFLEQRGLGSRPENMTKGGERHNMVARAIEHVSRAGGYRVSAEVMVGPTQFDLELTRPGQRILIQIAMSESEREAQALARIRSEPLITAASLVLVADTRALAHRILQRLESLTDRSFSSRVEVRIAGSEILAANGRA